MEILLKLTALCLVAATAAAYLSHGAGEYAALLLLAALLAGVTMLFALFGDLAALCEELVQWIGLSPQLFVPMWKVLAVALIETLGSALCRDAGKTSLASLLEIAGSACALSCALPLIRAVVELLEGWL